MVPASIGAVLRRAEDDVGGSDQRTRRRDGKSTVALSMEKVVLDPSHEPEGLGDIRERK